MKLYIDTSKRERLRVGLNQNNYEIDTFADKSQSLLPYIMECLNTEGKTLHDLTEIEVMTGPGSFTGLRVGVSVAQALAWGLNIPVNKVSFTQKKYIDIQY